jgi:hypothetical protein
MAKRREVFRHNFHKPTQIMSNATNAIPSCQARRQGRRAALPRLALSQLLLDNHTALFAEHFYNHNQHVTETSTPRNMDCIVQALDEALMITSGSFSAVSTSLPSRFGQPIFAIPQPHNAAYDAVVDSGTTISTSNSTDSSTTDTSIPSP